MLLFDRTLRRYFYLSATLVAVSYSMSGQGPTGAQSTSQDKGPVLFGTNTNLHDARNSAGSELGLVTSKKKKSVKEKRAGEFAVAPIPLVNPSIGNGGGLGVLYARHLGEDGDVSPPSSFGVGGFMTGSGSSTMSGFASFAPGALRLYASRK